MIRKSFRVGLKLGLLAALVAVIAKIVQSRQRPTVVPKPAATGTASWPPVEPEAGTPAPAKAETSMAAAPTAEPTPEKPAAPVRPLKAVRKRAAADGPVTWVEPIGDVCPSTHPVKAKLSSKIFHVLGGLSYDRTNPDRCYATPADAEADGLRAAKR